MKTFWPRLWLSSSVVALCETLLTMPVQAQIIPDNSLTIPSEVISGDDELVIGGGDNVGGNLFHSFQIFNINSGQRVRFSNPFDTSNNASDAVNIFARVTGSQISNIDGILNVEGGANFFLINPNGIIFGPDARLEVNGAFTASTADSFTFDGGAEFSASNSNSAPLVMVNIPVGLQLAPDSAATIISRATLSSGQDLTLVAGNLVLENGQVNAGGNIFLQGNRVSISNNPLKTIEADFFLPEDVVLSFLQNETGILDLSSIRIEVRNALQAGFSSEPDAELLLSGDIEIQGGPIFISNSNISTSISSQGRDGLAGDIRITSTDQITLSENSTAETNFSVSSTIESRNFPVTGFGGNITLAADGGILLEDGSALEADVFEFEGQPLSSSSSLTTFEGLGGDISVSAASVELRGRSRFTTQARTVVSESEFSSDTVIGGNITILSDRLILREDAEIALVNRQGPAGVLNISANVVNLDNGTLRTETGTSAAFDSANISSAGNININRTEERIIAVDTELFGDEPPLETDPEPPPAEEDPDLLGDRVGTSAESTSGVLLMQNESLISAIGFNGAPAGDISLENMAFVIGLPPTGNNGSDIITRGDAATAGQPGTITVGENVMGFAFQTAVPGNRTNDIETIGPNEPEDLEEVPEFYEFSPLPDTLPQSIDPIKSYCESASSPDNAVGLTVSGRGGLPTTPSDPLEGESETSDWVRLSESSTVAGPIVEASVIESHSGLSPPSFSADHATCRAAPVARVE